MPTNPQAAQQPKAPDQSAMMAQTQNLTREQKAFLDHFIQAFSRHMQMIMGMRDKPQDDAQIKEIKTQLQEDPSVKAVIPEIITFLYNQLLLLQLNQVGAPNG